MLSDRDAFKFGFLSRCVEANLSPEAMLATVKRAEEELEKRAIPGLDTLVDMGKSTLGVLGGYGVPLALAAPPVLGGMAGYGLAKGTDIDDTDIDKIKNQELIDEYRRQTQHLKRQKAIRDFRQSAKRPGRMF